MDRRGSESAAAAVVVADERRRPERSGGRRRRLPARPRQMAIAGRRCREDRHREAHSFSSSARSRFRRRRRRRRSSPSGIGIGEGRGGGGTYEERRARIECRAIEESRRAAADRDEHEEDENNDDDDDDENDVRSLSSWVGPLVVVDSDGDDGVGQAKKRCTYYQDRNKRYPFVTDERGFSLLTRLMETNRVLLRINRAMIEERAVASGGSRTTTTAAVAADRDDDGDGRRAGAFAGGRDDVDVDVGMAKDVIVRVGQGLYAHKPTLRTKGVTWSTEEYGHPGLQRMYLRMKSIQRFTEIWSLLERCETMGVFDEALLVGGGGGVAGGPAGVVRIVAIGGGPGYELLAVKLFFEDRAPPGGAGPRLELTCMDVCPAWRRYAEALGFSFVEYDIDNDERTNPLCAMGLEVGELHFCIVSCVMIYVTNDRTMKMFHDLVHDSGVRAILVSERGERTSACSMMEGLGGNVVRLIDQSDGIDERQAIWTSGEFRDGTMRAGDPDCEAHQAGCVFPNVPYCEHKGRRRFAGR